MSSTAAGVAQRVVGTAAPTWILDDRQLGICANLSLSSCYCIYVIRISTRSFRNEG